MQVTFDLDTSICQLGNPGLTRHLAQKVIAAIEGQLPKKKGQINHAVFTEEQQRMHQTAQRLRKMHYLR